MHGEAEHEDGEDGEKPGEILHEVADDDGPGTEEMVKRQEVQDLHTGEKEAQGE